MKSARHIELRLTERESKALRQVLKFTMGSLFALELPKVEEGTKRGQQDPDYRGYRVKKAELARLITHGLADVWRLAKKLDEAMKM